MPTACSVKANFRHILRGRLEFTPVGQLFVDLTYSSANVDHVLAAMQQQWGNDQVVVTADGLQMEGTQGM